MIDYDYDGEEMKVDSPFSVEITASLLDAVLHCKDKSCKALLSVSCFLGARTSIEENRLISSHVSSVIMYIDLSYILSVQPCAVTRCSAL